MGGCFQSKAVITSAYVDDLSLFTKYKPLFMLKQDLLTKLNMPDDHYFKIFITYRFKNSARLSNELKYNIKQLRRKQIGLYYNFDADK